MNKWPKIKRKIYEEKLGRIEKALNEVENTVKNNSKPRDEWITPLEEWASCQIQDKSSLKLTLQEYACLKELSENISKSFFSGTKNNINEFKYKFKDDYIKILESKENNLKLEISAELIEDSQFPLEIFSDWYVKNCNLPPEQFNEAVGKFWGDVWNHAGKGASLGALGGAAAGGIPTGGMGTFAGAGLGGLAGGLAGGLYGGGKNLLQRVWHYRQTQRNFEQTKQKALESLNKLKDLSKGFDLNPNFLKSLDSLINQLGDIKAYKIASGGSRYDTPPEASGDASGTVAAPPVVPPEPKLGDAGVPKPTLPTAPTAKPAMPTPSAPTPLGDKKSPLAPKFRIDNPDDIYKYYDEHKDDPMGHGLAHLGQALFYALPLKDKNDLAGAMKLIDDDGLNGLNSDALNIDFEHDWDSENVGKSEEEKENIKRKAKLLANYFANWYKTHYAPSKPESPAPEVPPTAPSKPESPTAPEVPPTAASEPTPTPESPTAPEVPPTATGEPAPTPESPIPGEPAPTPESPIPGEPAAGKSPRKPKKNKIKEGIADLLKYSKSNETNKAKLGHVLLRILAGGDPERLPAAKIKIGKGKLDDLETIEGIKSELENHHFNDLSDENSKTIANELADTFDNWYQGKVDSSVSSAGEPAPMSADVGTPVKPKGEKYTEEELKGLSKKKLQKIVIGLGLVGNDIDPKLNDANDYRNTILAYQANPAAFGHAVESAVQKYGRIIHEQNMTTLPIKEKVAYLKSLMRA